jgi:mRNA-degrading endonuclease RelE of RelBE toxin-antitoxin system
MEYESTPEFDEKFLKLTRKNKALKERLFKKIDQILDNPSIGIPKRNCLNHARGSHVNPYVIVYRIKGDKIQFLYVDHHDFVYEKSAEILKRIEREEDPAL